MDLPRTGRERRAGVIIENINELLKNKTNHTNSSLEEREKSQDELRTFIVSAFQFDFTGQQ